MSSHLNVPRETLTPHERMWRSRRRLRALERHLVEIGHRGEAYALANIIAELTLASATARIRTVA